MRTKHGHERALLDSGIEINVMSRDMADELELPISPTKLVRSAIEYKGQTGEAFAGVIENLLINVGGVEVTTHVFVAKVMDPQYRLILGTPYQIAARMEMIRRDSGVCVVTLRDQETSKVIKTHATEAEVGHDERTAEMLELSRSHLN